MLIYRVVLDFPQLYSKPSSQALTNILELLKLKPPSWDGSAVIDRPFVDGTPQAVASYLTKIISSPLTWLDDDETREDIWDLAGKRLSERSGRTGKPATLHLMASVLKTVVLRDVRFSSVSPPFHVLDTTLRDRSWLLSSSQKAS